MSAVGDVSSDAELLSSARAGAQSAIAELWQRHHRAAVMHARSLVGPDDAEDIAADAFGKVFGIIGRGNGPTNLFRPYLYTVIRNLASEEYRRRAHATDHDIEFDEMGGDVEAAEDQLERAANRSTVARAFRSLPERWQSVLWYLDVEGMRPRQVAPLVGLKPGAVSSLAYRARSGLRAAWVQEHLESQPLPDACRRELSSFGAYEIGTLSARGRRRLEAHLRGCEICPPVLEDARRLAARIAAAVLPIIGGLSVAHAVAGTAAPSGAASAATALRRTTPRRIGMVTAVVVSTAVLVSAVAIAAPLVGARNSESVAPRAGTPQNRDASNGASPSGRDTPDAAPPSEPDASNSPPNQSAAPDANIGVPTSGDLPSTEAMNRTIDQPAGPGADSGINVQPTTVTPVPPDHGHPITPTPPATRTTPPVLPSTAVLSANRSVDVVGTATPRSRIELHSDAGNGSVAVDSNGHWDAVLYFLRDGTYEVAITATAAGHATSLPTLLIITVDTTAPAPPTITTTWRATDTAAPTFTGTAEPGSVVTLSAVGQPRARTTATTDQNGVWTATLPDLLPTAAGVQATATDAAGNTSLPGMSDAFGFTPTFADPIDGDTVTTGILPVTIHGWAGSTVTVSVDDTRIGTATIGSDRQFSGHISSGSSSGLLPGPHTITATYEGAVTATTISITVVG